MAANGSQQWLHNATFVFLHNNSYFLRNVSQLANTTESDLMRRFRLVSPYIDILLSLTITVANTVVLTAFVKNRNLRTPFSMYLVSLLLADLAQGILDLPFFVVSEFLPQWPVALGRIGCNFNLYAKWIFSAAVRNTHSLISLNRIWALFLPISYKEYHTRTVAIWMCIGTWVYVHIFLLPGLVMDDLYYRMDEVMGIRSCQVNTTAQHEWALPTQIVVYNSSVFIVGISYPFIWWKVRQRRKVDATKNGELQMRTITVRVSGGFSNTVELRRGCPPIGQQSNGRTRGDPEDDENSMETRIVGSGRRGRNGQHSQRKSSQSFIVLTYLVLGVIFCWTPIMVYFTMAIVLPDYDNDAHFAFGSLLYYINSLLDPIFFTMAMAPLRTTVYHMFFSR